MKIIMKQLRIKNSFLAYGITLLSLSFHSCDESIELGRVDSSAISQAGATYLSLQNSLDARPLRVVDVFTKENGKAAVHVELNKPASEILQVELKPDKSLVDSYNQKNGTDFEMYPVESVTLENEGKVAIVPGDKKSASLTLEFKAQGEPGKSYLFPLRVVQPSNDVKLQQDSYIFVVTNKGDIPNTAKSSGIVTNFYLGLLGPNNPMNIGEWYLKKSKKPLVDIVCLFAANINYDKPSGRVEVRMNEHLTPLLENRERYLKPLQDKGIKITLSILGNWDAAGVANLSPETAKDFARELKAIVDAYHLDGVEFDDEYSEYSMAYGIPGFVPASSQAFARLCYEVKRIMPDKLCCVYHYGAAGFDFLVEGMKPGDFIDYTYEAFYSSINKYIQDEYLGMSKKQVGPYSRNIGTGLYFNESDMKVVRDEYGVNMCFAYSDEIRNSYKESFNRMAEILYGEGAECTTIVHSNTGL